MTTIVILGAGELGGALARQIAAADVVSRVVLVDEAAAIAQGKALDIQQAAPVDGYATAVTGTSDVSAVAGAAMVFLADRAAASGGEWDGDAGAQLAARVAALNARAPIVCAGGRQAGVIERAVSEHGLPRERVIGSAPEALRAAIVSMVALEAHGAPADVSLTVLGRPPGQTIVPWDEASIAGRLVPSVLPPPAIARLDARLPRLWPPGPLTLASAAARFAATLLTRSPQTVSAFVVLARGEGRAGQAAAMSVTLRPPGLGAIVAPSLSARDRVRLDVAIGK